MNAARPGVLMVTGAYHPEVSGAGRQCYTLVGRLKSEVDFTVLTTTASRSLQGGDSQNGVPVHRVFIDPESCWSKLAGAVRFTIAFVRISPRFSIVHLHGFSQKSVLLILLALAGRKKIAIKLTSVGHDDPLSIRHRDRLANWCFARADMFFAVSPQFRRSFIAAGLPAVKFRLIANGVDLERFRPAPVEAREASRRELSMPAGGPVVLFVGFFSSEKRPDVLFEAWASLARSSATESVLVFVGATRSGYYEIDESLATAIRTRADALGLSRRVLFVEVTHEIEHFHRAADVFVLPSVREGLPNALLEAMACGVACVATRLEGVTDDVIEDGRNGVLFNPDDVTGLARALKRLIEDPAEAARLGCEARLTIEARYGLDQVARQYLAAYRELQGMRPCAA